MITDSVVKSVTNIEYLIWFEHDQMLLSWINATLSESTLPYIVRMITSKDAWDSLEQRYTSLTRSHIFELKKRLQHLKKGTSTMQEYLHQIKVISNQLAACGALISEDNLVIHTGVVFPLYIAPFKHQSRLGPSVTLFSLKNFTPFLFAKN